MPEDRDFSLAAILESELAAVNALDQLGFLSLPLFTVLGILLAATPCTYPMYPVLLRVLTVRDQGGRESQAGARRTGGFPPGQLGAIFSFVFGLSLTYAALGVMVALGGQAFQSAINHPLGIVLSALFFVGIGLVSLGFKGWQWSLPPQLLSALSRLSGFLQRWRFQQQIGGRYAPARFLDGNAMLMGSIAGLMTSACTTAPLAGVLLYISGTGSVAFGAASLFFLGLGKCLPLILLGSVWMRASMAHFSQISTVLMGFLALFMSIWMLERLIADWLAQIAYASLTLGLALALVGLPNRQYAQRGVIGIGAGLALLIVSGALFNHALHQVPPAGERIGWHWLGAGYDKLKDAQNIDSVAALESVLSDSSQATLLFVHADWCIECQAMKRQVFGDPLIAAKLTDWRLLSLDLTEINDSSIALMEHLQLVGPPTLCFFDREGQEIRQQRVVGFIGPRRFWQHLEIGG